MLHVTESTLPSPRPARTDVEAVIAQAVQRVRAELEPAIDAVRRLHTQDDSLLTPGKWCPSCGHETPCPTIRALNEAGA